MPNKPNLDDKETLAMTPVAEIRSVQLNEKISDSEYQILHPETDAYQVITDPERRFVSEAEKKKWNAAFTLGATALHYKGKYSSQSKYFNYDVVYVDGSGVQPAEPQYPGLGDTNNDHHGRRFFVLISNLEAAQPGVDAVGIIPPLGPSYDKFVTGNADTYWLNINFESYLSEYAHNVRVESVDSGEYTFAITTGTSDDTYRVLKTTTADIKILPASKTIVVGTGENAITINGSTGEITAKKFIGRLEGHATSADRAEVSEKYVIYERDADGAPIVNSEGERLEKGTSYIDDAVRGLQKQLDDITNGTGGAILSNTLTIRKNNEILNSPGFDGSASQDINITFNPTEIDDLLDSHEKIKEKWLPDTLLGAMSYIGTFNAATGTLVSDLRDPALRPFRKGDYAIAVEAGNLDPAGASHLVDTAESTFFLQGDWAVYHGDEDGDGEVDSSEWVKIDNTDAVRTVNNQIGNVKTYKGDWTPNVQYYAGDIVQYGNPAALYLCIVDTVDAEFNLSKFLIFGRVYKADDGIELTESDNTFRHTHKSAKEVVVGGADNPHQLQPKEVIQVSLVDMYDNYGHIGENRVTYYKMPEDTWRPVKVNGAEIQGPQTNTGHLEITYDYRDGNTYPTIKDNDPRVKVEAIDKKIIVSHIDAKGGEGSHESKLLDTPVETGQLKIGLGTQFTAPTFAWNATGHVDAYSTTIFELPTDLVQHKHFNVVLENGRSIIRSYEADEFEEVVDKSRKFYDAKDGIFATPDSDAAMAFYGRLHGNGFYQLTRNYQSATPEMKSKFFRALDESMTFYSGNNLSGSAAIIGRFDPANNYLQLGDSGVHGLDQAVVYSAVAVNRKGITVAGGQILEFGRGEYIVDETSGESVWVSNDPSDSLVIGGLFFRNLGPKKDDNGVGRV